MFDLEQAILGWRKQLLASGIYSPMLLDELESHLREDIQQQLRIGIGEAHAFEIAARAIGEATTLKKEFMKTGNAKSALLRKLKSFLLGARAVPLPALDNFEPVARQTLEFAPEEARHFQHDFVGTEHLLLGLMQCRSKTVFNVMVKLGLKPESVRLEIERLVTVGAMAVVTKNIPYTPRARQALQLAVAEAQNFHEQHVRAEHIFLGLLREGNGVAALVLKNLGVRLERARFEILKEMDAPPA